MKIKKREKFIFNLTKTKIGLLPVFTCCVFFFLVGFWLQIPYPDDDSNARSRSRAKLLEYETMAHGVTGDDFISLIPFQVLSWEPRALYYPNFATAEQCQNIINMTKPLMEPSKLALRPGETVESTKNVRTSSGAFISAEEDASGVLDRIEEKIARVTMIPKSHGEDFNVLHYEIGQKYNSHYDAFHPAEYGHQTTQRIATFLLYLSDVEEGGETMFPYESGLNMDGTYNYQDCAGLRVKPRKGDGLLFYSLITNGSIDPLSIHGSCPVIRGEKWVATKWLRIRLG